MRRTKIIATIGPASDTDEAVDALIAAGVDIFRINFSHGDRASQQRMYERIRAAADRAGQLVAIMQDLAGPKIRTGRLNDGKAVRLQEGATLRIATGDFVGAADRLSTTFAGLAKAVTAGTRLLLDDGRIELRVCESDGSEVVTEVVHGGVLGEHKGINAPGGALAASALTEKDVEDLKFGVSLGVDFAAVSFVQTAEDLQRAREVAGPAVALVAKIERPQAVERFSEILQVADAIMVARGDLGLEIPLEHVPRVQKELTQQARAVGIPVIVATQVLDTMRFEPRPTRAEVNDAANAVYDGVDAIMLAGETAVGEFPALTVETLASVIVDAESVPLTAQPSPSTPGQHHGRALCEAALKLATSFQATVIVAVTRRGATAQQLAALRPPVPIFAVTDEPAIARRLTLSWGVASSTLDASELDTASIQQTLLQQETLRSGDTVVFVRVHSDLTLAAGNFLKLQTLP